MSAQRSLCSLLLFTISLCLLNPFVADATRLDGHEWTYEDQEIWSHQNHDCAGVAQSPINIDKRTTSINQTLNLEFYGYQNFLFGFNVVNNGHSVQFNYIGDERSAPMLSGSALNHENYSLAQFHFHWGQKRGVGSEHTIDERAYSMELHLVHFNRAKYSNLNDALHSRNGVAVLAVFFQIERERNQNFEEISRLVHKVQDRDPNSTVNPDQQIVLDGLLPNPYRRRRFYRYPGSLTTPPCTEGVTWLVMADSNSIGLEQIEQFRGARNSYRREPIGANYRTTQNLRGRIVEASFDSHKDSSSSLRLSSILLAVCFLSWATFNLKN